MKSEIYNKWECDNLFELKSWMSNYVLWTTLNNYVLWTTLNDYYNKTTTDNKYALKSDIPNINNKTIIFNEQNAIFTLDNSYTNNQNIWIKFQNDIWYNEIKTWIYNNDFHEMFIDLNTENILHLSELFWAKIFDIHAKTILYDKIKYDDTVWLIPTIQNELTWKYYVDYSITNALTNYYTKLEWDAKFQLKTDMSLYQLISNMPNMWLYQLIWNMPNMSLYQLISNMPNMSLYQLISNMPNMSLYALKTDLNNIDLSLYYNKNDTNTLLNSYVLWTTLTNSYFDKNTINTLLNQYVLNSWLNLNYYDKNTIDNKISLLNTNNFDLTNYFTKSEIQNNYVLSSYLTWNFYDKTYIDGLNVNNKVNMWYLTWNYYDKTNIDNQLQSINNSISWINNNGVD